MLDTPDSHAQGPVDLSHPLAVAAREIVVNRDNMDPLPIDGIQVGRECGNQSFSFTGFHLRDLALVQDHAADELHIVMPHAEGALGRLPYDGERLRQDVVEGLAVCQALTEPRRQIGQLGIGKPRHLRLELVDLTDQGLDFLQVPLILAAHDFG